jgi:Ran GTPase-activating protein (RanGAP) involved in mRNA processing and transport
MKQIDDKQNIKEITKILNEIEGQRHFIKLYYDPNIQGVNMNRVIHNANELKDLSEGLAIAGIKYFYHHAPHSDYKNALGNDGYVLQNLKQQLSNLQSSSDYQKKNELQTKVTNYTNYSNQISKILYEGIKNSKTLLHLDLKNSFINTYGNSLKDIILLNKLVYLDLSGNDINSSVIKQIAVSFKDYKSLKHLDLSNNQICYSGFKDLSEALIGNDLLGYLNISGQGSSFGYQGGEYLANILKDNKSIQHLDISNLYLSDTGIEYITKALDGNEILVYLNLRENQISTNGIKFISGVLKANKSIKQLNLSKNSFGDYGIKDLSEAIVENSVLEIVNLSESNFSQNSGEHLGLILGKNKSIKELNLSQNNINYLAAKLIAESLQKNGSLVNLDISKNKIDEAGEIFLGIALKENQTLQNLNISGNEVKADGGFVAFVHMAQHNKSLKILDVSENSIYDRGAETLSYIMDHFVELYLDNNGIGVKGAEFLSNALKGNKSLKILSLNDNKNIQDNGMKFILEALKNNKTLNSLHIGNTGISNNSIKEFTELLKTNVSLDILGMKGYMSQIGELIKSNPLIVKLVLEDNQNDLQKSNLYYQIQNNTNLMDIEFGIKNDQVSTLLNKNNLNLRENLRKLENDEKLSLTSEKLLILAKQLKYIQDIECPEIIYNRPQDKEFYFKKIVEAFIKEKSEDVSDQVFDHIEMQSQLQGNDQDMYLDELKNTLLGQIEI